MVDILVFIHINSLLESPLVQKNTHNWIHLFISSFALPELLATIDLFTVPIVLPFPECHRAGIIQHLALSDWLLSLANMH